jgi:hypothetical protein
VKRLIRTALVAAALAALPAGTAHAALIETAPCDDSALSKAFARWGDPALYKLAPGGDFEADGFSLAGNARVVSGSEPYDVTGTDGSKSVELRPGGSVTLGDTCMNAGNPTFRFFSKSSGGLLGLIPAMKAEVLYRDGALRLIPVPTGVVLPSKNWQPSLHQLTLSIVGGLLSDGAAPVAIRLTSIAGTWSVDDVLVDPYRRA